MSRRAEPIRRSARIAIVAGAIAVTVLGLAPRALGHAKFDDSAAYIVDSDQVVAMRVPREKGTGIHNSKVVVAVPEGFKILDCHAKAEWACSTEFQSDRSLIIFVRESGSGADDLFSFGLHMPNKAGEYPFVVSQTYSEGTVVVWDGDAESPRPAPTLLVVPRTQPPASPTPGPTPAPASPPAPAPTPAPVESGSGAAASPAAATAPATKVQEPAHVEAPDAHGSEEVRLAHTGESRGLVVLAGGSLLVGGLGLALRRPARR